MLTNVVLYSTVRVWLPFRELAGRDGSGCGCWGEGLYSSLEMACGSQERYEACESSVKLQSFICSGHSLRRRDGPIERHEFESIGGWGIEAISGLFFFFTQILREMQTQLR